jgi:hypothetical protein
MEELVGSLSARRCDPLLRFQQSRREPPPLRADLVALLGETKVKATERLLAADVVPWKTIGMLMMGMSEEEAAKFNEDRTIMERRMTQAIAERRERIRDEASLTLRETSKRLGMTESTARAHKLHRQAQARAMEEADRGLATYELGRRIEGVLRRRFAPAAAARACAGDDRDWQASSVTKDAISTRAGRAELGAGRRKEPRAAAARASRAEGGGDARGRGECTVPPRLRQPAGRRRSKRGRGEGDQSPNGAGKRTRANPGVG